MSVNTPWTITFERVNYRITATNYRFPVFIQEKTFSQWHIQMPVSIVLIQYLDKCYASATQGIRIPSVDKRYRGGHSSWKIRSSVFANYVIMRNITKSRHWWNIVGPMTFRECLYFSFACRHGSHWLVVSCHLWVGTPLPSRTDGMEYTDYGTSGKRRHFLRKVIVRCSCMTRRQRHQMWYWTEGD